MFNRNLLLPGLLVGVLGPLLIWWGNPANMGICVACFLRDIAGGLGLHQAAVVQYIRPEIPGFVLGAFLISRLSGEFQVRGGANPFLRFFLAILVMFGALVFLGCPLRMVYRLSSGDLNALVGVAGFTAGIYTGTRFLFRGFTLGRARTGVQRAGYLFPAVMAGLFLLPVLVPSILYFSESGPGSQQAPLLLALGAGLLVGIIAQKTRLCMVGGIRDVVLIRDFHLLSAFMGIFAGSLVLNLVSGSFQLGFADQPIAHTMHLWNFLGMAVVGLGSVLLGGCPLRQLIMAGQGDTDAAVTVMGLIAGGALAHNLGLAASPAGVPVAGQVAVILSLAILVLVGRTNWEDA